MNEQKSNANDYALAKYLNERAVAIFALVIDNYKYVSRAKEEMSKLDDELVELNKGNTSFLVTAEHLLELARKAPMLFESSQPHQKNKILRALLANLKLDEKRLQLNLLQPLSVLSTNLKSSNWLPIQVTELLQGSRDTKRDK